MPLTLSAAKSLILIRVAVMTVVLVFTIYFILYGSISEGFLFGLRRILFIRFGIDSIDGSAYNLGLVTGSLLLPISAMIAQLILINTRKRYAMLLIISAMEIVLAFARMSFPFLGLMVFVLLLWPNSRQYFSEDGMARGRDSILDDIDF